MTFKIRDLSISYNTFSASVQKDVSADSALKLKAENKQLGQEIVAAGGKGFEAQHVGDAVGGDSNPFESVGQRDQWNEFTAFDLQVAEQHKGLERMDDDCGGTGCGTTSGETDCGNTGCGTTDGGTDCGNTGCGTTVGETDCGSTGCGTTDGGTDCGNTGCGTTDGGTDCGNTGCGTTSGGTDCGNSGCGTTAGETDCGNTGCGMTAGSERGISMYTDLSREASLQQQLNIQLQKMQMNRF